MLPFLNRFAVGLGAPVKMEYDDRQRLAVVVIDGERIPANKLAYLTGTMTKTQAPREQPDETRD